MNIELHMGKIANDPFFSFAKCASHEVRGKVPSKVIPIPLPPLKENPGVFELEEQLNSLM